MADQIKIERFERALQASEFDVVIAATPENTWYLSESIIDTQKVLLERLAVVVWAKHSAPVYIVCTNEEIQARRESWIKDIRGYIEFQVSPMQLAADAVKEAGAASGRIGIEKHFLTAHYFEELRALLPNAQFVEVAPFFDKVRMVKTPDEIARLERAALATDRAMRIAFETAVPGTTEKQVGVRMTSELILGGAMAQAFQVLAAGYNSCATHQRAGDYVMQSGDVLRTDFGGLFEGGYYSDLARTMVVGKPNQRQLDTYRFIWEEQERLVAAIRPGVTAQELFLGHRDVWLKKGWSFRRPHIGHSLGVGIHESPILMASDATPLEPGMCIAIEPVHMYPDVEKYHVEDLVLVTEAGSRVLSHWADWSELLCTG